MWMWFWLCFTFLYLSLGYIIFLRWLSLLKLQWCAPHISLYMSPLIDYVQSCYHVEQRHSGASIAATLLWFVQWCPTLPSSQGNNLPILFTSTKHPDLFINLSLLFFIYDNTRFSFILLSQLGNSIWCYLSCVPSAKIQQHSVSALILLCASH